MSRDCLLQMQVHLPLLQPAYARQTKCYVTRFNQRLHETSDDATKETWLPRHVPPMSSLLLVMTSLAAIIADNSSTEGKQTSGRVSGDDVPQK
uniref:Uncharacterized protein n=1 Tax=Ciona savignyi TaxID=51511 RepID=H2YM31_CIOSA